MTLAVQHMTILKRSGLFFSRPLGSFAGNQLKSSELHQLKQLLNTSVETGGDIGSLTWTRCAKLCEPRPAPTVDSGLPRGERLRGARWGPGVAGVARLNC